MFNLAKLRKNKSKFQIYHCKLRQNFEKLRKNKLIFLKLQLFINIIFINFFSQNLTKLSENRLKFPKFC